jgi:hypothetical protein
MYKMITTNDGTVAQRIKNFRDEEAAVTGPGVQVCVWDQGAKISSGASCPKQEE